MIIGRHHGGKLLAGAALAALGRRTLPTASVAARGFAGEAAAAAQGAKYFYSGPARGGATATALLRAPAIGMRRESTLAVGEKEAPRQQQQQQKQTSKEDKRAAAGGKAITSYWGVEPSKVTRGDGTEWRWTCFRPTDTYKADVSIDMKKHHALLEGF